MKNGIANIWLLGIVIVFIALFSAYIAITINYSSSFKMKNEILSIIEKHKGLTNYVGETKESMIEGKGPVTANVGAFQTINYFYLEMLIQQKENVQVIVIYQEHGME